MSKFLENMFVGDEKRTLEKCSTQYEVDKFVADKRGSIAKKQYKAVLRRPAVLAAIFGAGAVKEMRSQKRKNDSSKSDKSAKSTSLLQYIMLAAKFV